MRKILFLMMAAFVCVAGAFAQSSGTRPDVVYTPILPGGTGTFSQTLVFDNANGAQDYTLNYSEGINTAYPHIKLFAYSITVNQLTKIDYVADGFLERFYVYSANNSCLEIPAYEWEPNVLLLAPGTHYLIFSDNGRYAEYQDVVSAPITLTAQTITAQPLIPGANNTYTLPVATSDLDIYSIQTTSDMTHISWKTYNYPVIFQTAGNTNRGGIPYTYLPGDIGTYYLVANNAEAEFEINSINIVTEENVTFPYQRNSVEPYTILLLSFTLDETTTFDTGDLEVYVGYLSYTGTFSLPAGSHTIEIRTYATPLGRIQIDAEAGATVPTSSLMGLLKGDGIRPMTYPWAINVYSVQASTDEISVPRQDANAWYDGGIYQEMQQHTWTPDNVIVQSAWNYCYNIIGTCNTSLNTGLAPQSEAEVRLLRAYAYYRLLDLFGNVPLLLEDNITGVGVMPANSTRAEVFSFVEGELNDAIMENISQTEELNAGMLNMLKARLYLNSKVFLGLGNTPEYQAYLQKAIDACDAVIASGKYSLESNIFANWYTDNGYGTSKEIIFAIPYAGYGSPEGNELPILTLMPSLEKVFRSSLYGGATSGYQVNPGMTADDPNALFNLFNAHDNRRLAILSGQLYNRDKYVQEGVFEKLTYGHWYAKLAGTSVREIDPLNPYGTPNSTATRPDRQVVYANLAPWFENRGFSPNLDSQTENSYKAFGARIAKFEWEENPSWSSPVDMVVMRYAEVLYTKAEALIRLGRNAEAIPLFQEVLANRGFDPMSSAGYNKDYPFRDMDTDMYGNDKPSNDSDGLKISAVALQSKRWLTDRTTDLSNYMPIETTLEFMEKEWRREFAFEDRRRTDMIRFGKFTTTDWGMHTATNDPTKNLFPIPQLVRTYEPNVKQNPGYEGYDGWLTSVADVLADGASVSYYNNTLSIESTVAIGDVAVYSITGVQVEAFSTNSTSLTETMNLPAGVYIVRFAAGATKILVP